MIVDGTGVDRQGLHLLEHVGIIGLVMIGLGALVALWLTRRLVAPINAVSQAIAQDDPAETRHFRILTGLPQEIQPLVRVLGDFRKRLNAVREHEQRMIAGLAHELRTPLATMRVHLELSASKESLEVVALCLRELSMAQGRTNALFQLARLESGREHGRHIPVSLIELIADAWAQGTAVAGNQGRTLEVDVPADLELLGDPDLLATVFVNLLGNALRHGGLGAVWVHAWRLVDRAVVQVSNPVADHPDRSGAGLGLALVTAITRAQGAACVVREAEGVYVVELEWPARWG